MRKLMLMLVLLCGCSIPTTTYKIELVQPNGDVNRTWTLESMQRPTVKTTWGGHSHINNCPSIQAPTGWLLAVREVD